MTARLRSLQAGMIPPFVSPEVDEGNPEYFGGYYSPGWCVANEEGEFGTGTTEAVDQDQGGFFEWIL